MAHSPRGGFWEDVAGGLRGLLGGGWPRDDRPFAVLLDMLVRGSKLQDDMRVKEAEAPAVSTRGLEEEESRLARQELDAARADLPDFERALIDAWRRSDGTASEIPYDSADPAQDRAADMLIRYLVTTREATVRTEERDGGRYTYYLTVHWDALLALAEVLEVDLRAALDHGIR
jgi:hypothetical protein